MKIKATKEKANYASTDTRPTVWAVRLGYGPTLETNKELSELTLKYNDQHTFFKVPVTPPDAKSESDV